MSQFKSDTSGACFLFRDISHFFTPSQVVDYHLGIATGISLQRALSLLEQGQYTLNPLIAIFAFLFTQNRDNLQLNQSAMRQLVNNDGVKLLVCGVQRVLGRLGEKDGGSLENQMALKALLNLIYICVDFLELNQTNPASSQQLNQLFIDVKFDDTLMRMVTLSLQAHYIPIKKLTMLYTKVLANLFHYNGSPNIHPLFLFSQQIIASLPQDNLLRYGQLQRLKASNPPPTGPVIQGKVSSIQQFYVQVIETQRRHNTGECPLAQSIVVGLLRSLLTVCNCQSHKRFQTVKGSGVDSFREWQLSYRLLLERPQLQSALPAKLLQHLRTYEAFDQVSTEGRTVRAQEQSIWGQFYTHKIYTTAAIATFFQLVLVALHQNMFLQYSYFLQLISDANGILVFLKFLTDKFTGLELVQGGSPFRRGETGIEFREEVMLTVYAVLLMLYNSCNNYPEKIRNFLFDYNSYLIIKKIPILFLQQGQSREIQGLPSREQLQALTGKSSATLRKLTELCFDLLKIQIPFFSKKNKENAANMRMIIDIYCKYPKIVPPRQLSALDKLLLKTKSGLLKEEKFITSVQEMKTVHNDYNNLYYWSNDFLQEQSRPPTAALLNNMDNMIDAGAWLQENLWKYYD